MTAATVRPTEEWNSADAWAALHHAETSPHDLASIARAFPHYAEQIAGHPRAYPALVEWAGVVAAGRRPTSQGRSSTGAGITDVLAAGRRDSGAHPLAISADAAAWRAAVAEGAALTRGAERTSGAALTGSVERTADGQADRAFEPVRWTPGGPTAPFAPVAAVAGGVDPVGGRTDPAAVARSGEGADDPVVGPGPVGSPWWADVTPRAAPALPAASALPAPMSSPRERVAADAAPMAARATASAPADRDHPAIALNGKALLGFVFAFVLAPLGIVFAHLALREIRRTGEAGQGYARAGLVIGYAVVALGVLAAAVAPAVVPFG